MMWKGFKMLRSVGFVLTQKNFFAFYKIEEMY